MGALATARWAQWAKQEGRKEAIGAAMSEGWKRAGAKEQASKSADVRWAKEGAREYASDRQKALYAEHSEKIEQIFATR